MKISYGAPNTVYEIGTTLSFGHDSKYYIECTKSGTAKHGVITTESIDEGQTFSDGDCSFVVKKANGSSWETIYPIGSIFMNINPTSPEQLFGGKWQQLEEGRVLLCAGKTYQSNTTGGHESITLTENELPSHTHNGTVSNSGAHGHTGTVSNDGAHTHTTDSVGNHTHNISSEASVTVIVPSQNGRGIFHNADTGSYTGKNLSGLVSKADYGGSHKHTISAGGSHNHLVTIDTSGAHGHTVTIDKIGKSKPFSIMQPYFSVYMWIRIE